jgi:hypothetical protein
MPQPTADPAIIRLENVRLSFPQLFHAKAVQENQEPKFGASFILDNEKHKKLLDQIEATIERMALDFWKKKVSFKHCLHDGNEKEDLDGYGDGTSYISASSKRRPVVVDRGRNPVTEEDGVIYAGCYVNATIRLWVQNNDFGRRVNAELRAVQFVKDGESFGAGPVDPESEFEELGDEGNGGSTGNGGGRSRKAPSMDDPMF